MDCGSLRQEAPEHRHETAPDLEAVQYEAVPDTSADAELARRIVDKESKKIEQRGLKRCTVPDLTEAPEPLNDYASRDEEIARRLGEHTEVDRCQRITLVDRLRSGRDTQTAPRSSSVSSSRASASPSTTGSSNGQQTTHSPPLLY